MLSTVDHGHYRGPPLESLLISSGRTPAKSVGPASEKNKTILEQQTHKAKL